MKTAKILCFIVVLPILVVLWSHFANLLNHPNLGSYLLRQRSSYSLAEQIKEKMSGVDVGQLVLNTQFKGWNYNVELWVDLNTPSGEKNIEDEMKRAVIKSLEALYAIFESSDAKYQLYYKPSNIYLYKLMIESKRDRDCFYTLKLKDGMLTFIKTQYYLNEYTPPNMPTRKAESSNDTVIWKKSLEEVAEEMGLGLVGVKRDPLDVFNFSEDEAVRSAILKVRERVYAKLLKEGYKDYVAFPYEEMSLKNKEAPYEWAFAFIKKLPELEKSRRNLVPFDEAAYKEEYKQLHEKVLKILNEAPEVKPYLKHPIYPRDLRLNIILDQRRWEKGNVEAFYQHLIVQTPNAFVMEKIAVKGLFGERNTQKVIPLSEFYEYMGI